MYSSDMTWPEYQEAFFYYLFGIKEMGCYGILDLINEKTTVFIPRQDEFYKIWMTVMDTQQMQEKYPLIDQFLYVDEIEDFLKSYQPQTLYLNGGKNGDTGRRTLVPEEELYAQAIPSDAVVDLTFMHNVL